MPILPLETSMNRSVLALVGIAALLASGCSQLFNFDNDKTTPTDPTGLTTGQWSSVSSATSLTTTCTNFKWTIVDISGTSGTGTFTATCMGNMQVAGSAAGTLTGTEVTWTATATGTAPGGVTCPISLTGTATYDGTQFRIPYSGSTCLGPVAGTEILRKT
jgi:hypothetical protein